MTPSYGKKWLNSTEKEKWDREILDQMDYYLSNYTKNEYNDDQDVDYRPVHETKKIKILSYLNESSVNKDSNSYSRSLCLQDYFNKIQKLNDDNLN